MIQVKDSLQHGEWGKWLEEKVDFTYQTANKFMKVATEYEDYASMRDLGTAKLFAMLSMSTEDRDDFIKQPHTLPSGTTKTIGEMTTRELQAAIKASYVSSIQFLFEK